MPQVSTSGNVTSTSLLTETEEEELTTLPSAQGKENSSILLLQSSRKKTLVFGTCTDQFLLTKFRNDKDSQVCRLEYLIFFPALNHGHCANAN